MHKLDIVYEDKHLLIVNKPVNLLTISTLKEKEKTLYHEVFIYLHKKNQKVFIVNRLDKETSGLVMFAKSEKVKQLMQNNWNNVVRKYCAIIEGVIKKSGKIEDYLKDDSTFRTYSNKTGKYALTLYYPLKNNNKYTLVDINIKTGRKNQIRYGFSSINHPIIGDKKYGSKYNLINRLCLHSYYLCFIHPISKQKIELCIDEPFEFKKILP